MNNAAGKINETYPHRELAITEKTRPPLAEHAGAFLPLAVLASVARLAGCALVATVSEALTGGGEPARKEIIFSASRSEQQEG